MDIVFVTGIDITWDIGSPMVYMGAQILKNVLQGHCEAECINYNHLIASRELKYTENMYENMCLFSNYILAKNPKVVGFTTVCHSFLFMIQVAKHIKEIDNNIKIVFGGPHSSIVARECLDSLDFLDVVALGEFELSIKHLMDTMVNGSDIRHVPGIMYRLNGKIMENPAINLIKSEDLGIYTVYDYSPLAITMDEPVYIEGGRGCPYGCSFCSTSTFWGRQHRVKPACTIIKEMKKFNFLYGVTKFSIIHDLFTANKLHIQKFCNMVIGEKLPFSWACSSRTDVLDKETLMLMKQANCKSIYLGIETGSPRMQKVLNKNLKVENAVNVVKYILSLGFNVTVSFIYCLPEETAEDFQFTIKMIEEFMLLGINTVQLHRFVPHPKTADTLKIKDNLYFDEESGDFETLNNRVLNDEYRKLILQWPDIFTQYYTFESDVKSRYGRFNVMIILLNFVRVSYAWTVNYMLQKYGLEAFYFKYKHIFEELFLSMQEMNNIYNSQSKETLKYKYFNALIEEEELTESYGFSQMSKYEQAKAAFLFRKNDACEIHKFGIDIAEMKKNNIVLAMEYHVRFSFKGEKMVVSKYIPGLAI